MDPTTLGPHGGVSVSGLLIAGVSSGVGKTTVTVGLIAALRRRGLRVQPFKVGPDYIDPSYHAQAAGGRPSRNLDLWLLSPPVMRTLFGRAMRAADIAVVEGVMGLYDGRLGGEGLASSAHVARELGLPVVLVLDAGKLSWSAGALVLGYRSFDPRVRLAGVILNRVGGERHAAELIASIEQRAGVPVLGWLPKQADLAVPERQLGLVPTTEGEGWQTYLASAEAAVARGVDLDRVLALAAEAADVSDDAPELFPAAPVPPSAAIAVARDRAFSFYYQDGLDLLAAWGAELIPFSPLQDADLPAEASAVYIGGGFPELFAADLAANHSMLDALRAAHARGRPMYAECGGLMLLGGSLVDASGRRHAMAGVAPMDSSLVGTRLTIGYRDARARQDTLLLDAGQTVRAHEFHWSSPQHEVPASAAAYDVDDRQPATEGFASRQTLASYLHLHFGADASGRLARRFVDRAAAARGEGLHGS
jgi:cobyrinic acid a,c-diamide synthase